ncbi:elongation factor P [Candidatus Poribacteria bacterium]|nr:MAG: elongation factor P [Candidatus Poribacteria bacterium]
MAALNDLRNGLVIRLNDTLYTIVDCQHVKPGKGGAFARTKIKRITDGAVLDRTFRASETVETARLMDHGMQYLYRDGEVLCFMDNETFEQHSLPVSLIGDSMKFLKEGVTVTVKMEGTVPLALELPNFVELQIVETDPGLRGDTVSGGSKRATLETGAVVNVPLFVQNETTIKVDTRTGKYVERV